MFEKFKISRKLYDEYIAKLEAEKAKAAKDKELLTSLPSTEFIQELLNKVGIDKEAEIHFPSGGYVVVRSRNPFDRNKNSDLF
jgi:hypothetical protein